MKRERNIITIDEYGRLDIPTDTAAIWMTEAEIVELFGTTAGVVSSAIKTIIKSDALNDYEVCKCIRLSFSCTPFCTRASRMPLSPSWRWKYCIKS